MNSLYEYLNECQQKIGTITIDQGFLDFRTEMLEKFNPGAREEWKRIIHADCLIAEYALITGKYVQEPTSIRHDIIYDNAKIDIKFITSKYFNIPENKVEWYLQNIKLNELTHFAFYKYDVPADRTLKLGDTVNVTLHDVQPAKKVMNEISVSNYGGYYYTVKK